MQLALLVGFNAESMDADMPFPFQWVHRHARPIRWVCAALLVAAVFLMIRSLPFERPVEWLKGHSERLGPWAPAVFVLLFVGLTVFLLPGWPLNVAAGVLFGPFAGGLISVVASNGSAAVSFLIGRLLARRRAERMVRRFPRVAAVYHTLGRQEGWKMVAAVRLSHALPFGVQDLLLGATPVTFWPYLLTTFAVTLPGIFVVAYLGYLGATALEPDRASSTWTWVGRIVGLLIAMGALAYIANSARRAIKNQTAIDFDQNKEAMEQPPDRGRPYATLALMAVTLLLLIVAVVSYVARERIHQFVEQWLA
jgi:uncharacterized membrane protein YdjX (TVP38/TMEM64 family)